MLLEEMKHPEIKAYLKNKKSILLPFGSNEQHGPHLPTGTDSFIAAQIAKEAGERTGTVVAPTLPIGFSPGLHTHFPGTITISACTYLDLILEILSSVIDSGFRDLLVLTGHGMNYWPLKTAMLDFLSDHHARAMVLGYWEDEQVSALTETGDGVHCTILETSMMLYLRPELVDMEKSFDEYRETRFMLGKEEVSQVSASGTIAETTKSTPEKGRLIFEAAVNGIARRIQILEEGNLFR